MKTAKNSKNAEYKQQKLYFCSMEQLITQSRALVRCAPQEKRRYLFNRMDWGDRLIFIMGSRGTGKTTLLLQHMRMIDEKGKSSVYLSLDDFFFSENRLTETVRKMNNHGIVEFYLDEVHQYSGWAREVKNIYDFMPEVRIVLTGSCEVDLKKESIDLSRRAVSYDLHGLSFREFLNWKVGTDFTAIELDDLFLNHEQHAFSILEKLKPLRFWKDYLQFGYFPFVFESPNTYHHRLRRVMNTILESDLRFIHNVSSENIEKIKRLIYILAESVPFKPNITKLSERVGLDRGTLTEYIYHLREAKLINTLMAKGKSTSILRKPDKLYLNNTNMAYALLGDRCNIGTLRETFFQNQLEAIADLRLPEKGDFFINDKYTVEVGGSGKSKQQIHAIPHGYVAADDIEEGALHKIPLWLFGFLY